MTRIVPTLLLLSTSIAAAQPRPVAMLPLHFREVASPIAATIEELMLQSAHDACKQDVIGAADIRAMIDAEVLKQAAGCDGGDAFCFAEIGGALGVSYLLSASLSALGDELILSLTLIDQKQGSVLSREQVRVPQNESLYADAVNRAVVRVFREAGLARPPSRDLEQDRSLLGTTGWILVGGAITMVAAGSVVLALRPGLESIEANEYASYQSALTQETADSAYAEVRGAVDYHNTLTTVGWILFGVGAATTTAALIVFYLRPSEEEVFLSLTPAPDGGALLFGGRF